MQKSCVVFYVFQTVATKSKQNKIKIKLWVGASETEISIYYNLI